MHVALINGNANIIKKSLALLTNKKKDERIVAILQKNKEGHEPSYYTNDETIKLKLKNLIGMDLPSLTNDTIKECGGKKNEAKKANDAISFFDDSDISKQAVKAVKANANINTNYDILSDVIGHTEAKERLNNLIIQPYKNNQFIPINGFLIYGPSGVGKTHLVKSLFRELNEEFKTTSSLADFEKALDDAKIKFDNSKKQTLVFLDNIDVLLPKIENGSDNARTSRLMQLIEVSASKGVILVGVTDKKYSIELNAIASNRFDEHIELNPLRREDRIELIKFYTQKLQLSDETIAKIVDDTSLLTLSTIEGILKKVQFVNKAPQHPDFKEAVLEYAKDKKLDITARGKTATYDTVFPREVTGEYDPKSLDEVRGDGICEKYALQHNNCLLRPRETARI